MSLAHLWREQGTHTEARELLAPISSWFTEGFDTADLQEAQALLEELASRRRHVPARGAARRPRSACTLPLISSPRLCPSHRHATGTRAHGAEDHSCTGVRTGAPLA